jgi:CBS domain-containing protein
MSALIKLPKKAIWILPRGLIFEDDKFGRSAVKSKTVKEVMVPLAEYATVNEGATLYDAVMALEKAQKQFSRGRYQHRAILVLRPNDKIVGKISQMDVLKALEPKYRKIGDTNKISRAGFSPEFLKSMLNSFGLWQEPLADICKKALALKVKNFMYTPTEGEYIQANAALREAIHQLVMGSHHSLLVLDDQEKIVGVLRLTDVFEEVSQTMRTCQL